MRDPELSDGQGDRTSAVDLVRRVWSGVGDRQLLLNLLADDARLEFTIPDGTAIAPTYEGKQAVTAFYEEVAPAVASDGAMRHLGFGDQGNRVLMLAAESYTVNTSGARCSDKEFCVVVEIERGMIVRILQIKDFTELVAAHPPAESPVLRSRVESKERSGAQ
jgi:ketosteroid isomerase-like protein